MISFLKMEFERIGSGLNITPREVIRDFIEILNILYQNQGVSFDDVVKTKVREDKKTVEKNTEEFDLSDIEI